MSWKLMQKRMLIDGDTIRDNQIISSRFELEKDFKNDVQYNKYIIDNITNEEIPIKMYNEKKTSVGVVCSFQTMSSNEILLGQILHDTNTNMRWMCTEVYYTGEIYYIGVLTKCNFLFHFQNYKGEIIERYGVSEDGTAYSNGEKEDKTIITSDFQQNIQLTLDDETFLIKDEQRIMPYFIDREKAKLLKEHKISIPVLKLTKRNAINNTYNDNGIIKFTYTQVSYNENTDVIYDDKYDGKYDCICDVRYIQEEIDTPIEPITDNYYAEITYKSECSIKSGGRWKEFYVHFYNDLYEDVDLSRITDINWTIINQPNKLQVEYSEDNSYIQLKIFDNDAIATNFELKVNGKVDGDIECECSISVYIDRL